MGMRTGHASQMQDATATNARGHYGSLWMGLSHSYLLMNNGVSYIHTTWHNAG